MCFEAGYILPTAICARFRFAISALLFQVLSMYPV